MTGSAVLVLAALPAAVVSAQSPPVDSYSRDVFPGRIADGAEPLLVNVSDFARVPGVDGEPARLQRLVDVPGAGRLFVATDRGMIYAVSYDGADVSLYLDVGRDGAALPPKLVLYGRRQGFLGGVAFHPRFADEGAPGFGKFYTLTEASDNGPSADFRPGRGSRDVFDTVLLEWTARDPAAWSYDGGPAREVMRIEQPYEEHNGGAVAFRPGAGPSAPDYGLLYMGLGDGGGEGDPLGLAQDLSKVYGKLLRIDPLGSNSANGRYGVPADNPFAGDGREDALGEIWAYGLRNPSSFGWDASNGNLYVADIGEAVSEEISLVRAGANLGWSRWEGSFRVVRRRGLARRLVRLWSWAMHFAAGADFLRANGQDVATAGMHGDAGVTYPVVEYGRHDPMFAGAGVAVTGVVVCRECGVAQLNGHVLFGDLPSGALMYFPADGLAKGGPEALRQVLLVEGAGDVGAEGAGKTLLQLVQEERVAQGRAFPGRRVDLRFATSASGDVFLLNKRDGVVRRLDGPSPGLDGPSPGLDGPFPGLDGLSPRPDAPSLRLDPSPRLDPPGPGR